jgi:hypothetical protein
MWCTNFKTNKKIFRYEKISIVAMATIMVIGSIFTSCEAVKIQINAKRSRNRCCCRSGIRRSSGNNLGKGGNGAVGAVLGGVIGGVAGGVMAVTKRTSKREIDAALQELRWCV